MDALPSIRFDRKVLTNSEQLSYRGWRFAKNKLLNIESSIPNMILWSEDLLGIARSRATIEEPVRVSKLHRFRKSFCAPVEQIRYNRYLFLRERKFLMYCSSEYAKMLSVYLAFVRERNWIKLKSALALFSYLKSLVWSDSRFNFDEYLNRVDNRVTHAKTSFLLKSFCRVSEWMLASMHSITLWSTTFAL